MVAVGAKVAGLAVGDRVALGADVPCGTCRWCTNGMGTNCRINYAIGYQFPGGFQQYMLLNETTLKYGPVTPIPAGLSFAEAALAEPLACALNGLELARFSLGKSICVIGLGPIGCMMLELTRVFGATKVFAAQRSRARLDMARRFLPEARYTSLQATATASQAEVHLALSLGPDRITLEDGGSQTLQQLSLPAELSSELFRRSGRIRQVSLALPKEALLGD